MWVSRFSSFSLSRRRDDNERGGGRDERDGGVLLVSCQIGRFYFKQFPCQTLVFVRPVQLKGDPVPIFVLEISIPWNRDHLFYFFSSSLFCPTFLLFLSFKEATATTIEGRWERRIPEKGKALVLVVTDCRRLPAVMPNRERLTQKVP